MADYTGVSILELAHMPLSLFLLIRKDSWIDELQQSEEGIGFLKDLWRINQTKADLEAVRRRGGKK